MVATLLRIRFRVLGNTLSRYPAQLVGFIFGAFGAVWALAAAGFGLFFAGVAGVEAARAAVIAGGAAVTLGWIVGPIFVAGVDTTLDPAKLAPFPMSTSRMMVAITAAGATGTPGIACAIGALFTFLAWWRWPLGAAGAIVAVPLGFLIWVVASRTVASLASGLGGSRRTREAVALITFAVLIFASPIILGILSLVRAAADAGAQILGVIDAVSWTPLAAAWSVPGDLATGSPLTALAKLAIALATLALLWLLWHRSLSASLVSAPSRSARVGKAGRLGLFGVMPATPFGATWARSLTTWVRDMRYLRQLLLVPFFPILMLIYSGGDTTRGLFPVSALLVAFFVGIVPYSDVSYDGTAFTSVLQTGIRGRADRLGRMLGAASLGLPLTVVVAVAVAAISDTWGLLPATLGAALALLLCGYGVSAVCSALLVVPVPAAGDSAFKRVPGSNFTMFLVFLGCWIGVAVLALPALIPAIIAAVTGSATAGWAALIIGAIEGPVVFAVGILVGGRVFDTTAPSLLLRIMSFKGI